MIARHTTPAFLAVSFLSSAGDAIFLAGIPLFLFQDSGSVTATTLVPFAIILTVIAAQHLVRKTTSDAVSLVAYGELAMGGLEFVVIGLYSVWPSKWLIVAAVVPLALIYNYYA